MASFLSWYNKQLIQRPYTSKSITGFFVFGLGDILCQNIEKRKKLEFGRILKSSAYGFLASLVLYHNVYNRLYPWLFPETLKYSTLKTVLFDETVFMTVCAYAYYTYMDLFLGKNIRDSLNETTYKKLWPTLLACWKLWPIVIYLTLTYVPIHQRVLVLTLVNIVWASILSFMQNKAGSSSNAKDEDKNKKI